MPAGLILHTSNQLERLADDLARVLSEPLASPLTPEIIVVQSNGMRRWLTQQLANAHSVCANVRFPFPQNFFADLLENASPQTERASVYGLDAMTWRIWKTLPQFLGEPAFAPVARYLNGERAELRGYDLSRRIAQTFEQYLVFRPEMMLRWDAGEGQDWQSILWREVQLAAPGKHRAALGKELRSALQRNAPAPGRVAVFGLATLAPFYLSLLQTLAARAPVHLFVLEPTPEWWGDTRTRRERARDKVQLDLFDSPEPASAPEEITNPLLTENSRVGRDFLNLIWELDGIDDCKDFVRPAADTMLHCVQRDLYELRDGAPIEGEHVFPDDHSLQIHSCHSVTRELEVLHDQLLALFEDDRDLKPGDIVVMMPNIADYAPFIDAVFGVPEDPAQRIPYTIADRTPRARSGVIDSFLRILELLPGRFGASEVFAVLESPAVQRRFKMRDLPLLQHWAKESGIRWGIDAAHRARLGLPALAENAWRAGLDRMLLGYAMPPGSRALIGGILPFDEIEGSNAELLGNFVDCLEALFDRAKEFAQPRSLSIWQHDLREALAQFLEPDEMGQIELTQLRTALDALKKIAAVSENENAVSLEIAKMQLENSLGESRAGFLAGAITFGALKPAVPAKVVCLLGVNDAAFPRRTNFSEFDLIAQSRRRGDRNRRDDDRALFLEALLSARKVFYVSYLGQSMRDNKDQPPSVLVSELIDYIAQRFARDAKEIPVKHSLQAFSAKNFGVEDSRRFSFSQENAAAGKIAAATRREARPFVEMPLPEPGDEWREISVPQLVSFFECPAKFFVRERLGLELPRDRDELEDREPFEMHPLARYALAQELLDDILTGGEPSAAIAKARGVLPAGGAGEIAFESLCEDVSKFAATLTSHLTPLASPQDVRLEIGPFVVTGKLDRIRGDALVHFRLAKLKTKDFVRIWLEHLLRNVTERKPSRLFGSDCAYEFSPIDDALPRLQKLLELYWAGLRVPLPLFPRTSWKFVESTVSPSRARAPWLKEWKGSDDDEGRGEKREPYIALGFRGVEDPIDDTWEKCAREIYLPIVQARRVIS